MKIDLKEKTKVPMLGKDAYYLRFRKSHTSYKDFLIQKCIATGARKVQNGSILNRG